VDTLPETLKEELRSALEAATSSGPRKLTKKSVGSTVEELGRVPTRFEDTGTR
jgi:hypothetical protein